MNVEVETPEDFMGNVMGDLSSARTQDETIGAAKLSALKSPVRNVRLLDLCVP